MNKIIKISSNEGGVFTGTNNRVSFNIPEGAVYDLSKSYINLVSSIPITSNTGVVCPIVKMGDDKGVSRDNYFRNSALVKNVRFSSQLGSIENIQRSDILSHNIADYTEDSEAYKSHKYQDLCQPVGESLGRSSIFNELHKEGTTVSKNLLRQPVRVKCSDIMNFWKTTQYNTSRYGMSRLDLELNIDKIKVSQWLSGKFEGTGDNFDSDSRKPWEQGGVKLNNFTNMTATVNPVGDKLQIGLAAAPHPFNRLEDQCLYWVGQQITVKGVITSANGKNVANLDTGVVRTITAINYNRGQNTVDVGMTGATNQNMITLTLDAKLTTADLAAAETITGLQCVGVDATFGAYQVDYAELVLEQLANPDTSQSNQPISYTSYSTEEFDCPSTQNFQRTFSAEAEAITLYIMSPYAQNGAAGMINSNQNDFVQYRLRIDGKDTSGRLIKLKDNALKIYNDPLHIQKQVSALANSGKKLKNLLEVNYSLSVDADINPSDIVRLISNGDPDERSKFMIGQVLPRTNQEKQIQVNIDCESGKGVERLILFKEVQKMI